MLALDRLAEWEEGWKGELKSVEYTSRMRARIQLARTPFISKARTPDTSAPTTLKSHFKQDSGVFRAKT
jgi:hypothetical protein